MKGISVVLQRRIAQCEPSITSRSHAAGIKKHMSV